MSPPDEPPASAYIADPRGEFLDLRNFAVAAILASLPLWALAGAVAWWMFK